MIKIKKGSFVNSIFFIVLTLASIFLIYKNRNSKDLILFIMLGASGIYIAWALIFHKIDKSLTLPVFLEYLLTAGLLLILMLGILYN